MGRGSISFAMLVLLLSLHGLLSAQEMPGEPPSTSSWQSVAHQPQVSLAPDVEQREGAAASEDKLGGLLELEIEQLRQVPVAPALEEVVSTVARQESTVGRSPAAVYIVTPEMIRRSGAQTIPEALRMVPGLQVAQRDSNKWAISSRGFNKLFSNRLLVQIDGRTVYTPVFAGTYWDVQDVVMEDVERIEVIRGPGATV